MMRFFKNTNSDCHNRAFWAGVFLIWKNKAVIWNLMSTTSKPAPKRLKKKIKLFKKILIILAVLKI